MDLKKIEALKNENEDAFFPDYKNSILGLSASILQYFGVKPEHETFPPADEMLSRKYKHVVVIILDGLGMNILEQNLHFKDFLRRHLLTDYSSVFPPTTTASTTSFLSGKSPVEHGWLGWDVYFGQEDKTVTCFKNTIQGTSEQAAPYNVAEKYLPYESIIEKINKTGTAKAFSVLPFGENAQTDLYKWVETIRKTCKTDQKTFTYAYWANPDTELHQKGTKSNDIEKLVRELNEKITYLCEETPNTLFFITADHGHTDIRNDFLQENYPDLANMLLRQPSVEPRALSFFVKPEFLQDFPKKFKQSFGHDYILLTKQEALDIELFGPGKPNENLTGIGDFVAIATGQKTLLWNKNQTQFKSHHAGITKNEMRIPLICYKNRPRHIGLIIYYCLIAAVIAVILLALF